MIKNNNSEKVPKKMQPVFDAVVELTNSFCGNHLNEEYAQLSRRLTATMCRKRPSPLVKGRVNAWACGIVYALGFVNFLFDKANEPYMNATDLCKGFGVSKSAGSAKSKVIRDAFNMMQLDPNISRTIKSDIFILKRAIFPKYKKNGIIAEMYFVDHFLFHAYTLTFKINKYWRAL